MITSGKLMMKSFESRWTRYVNGDAPLTFGLSSVLAIQSKLIEMFEDVLTDPWY